MREFFRGWKPKLGVATLMMACVFIAVWVRSLATVELMSVNFPHSNFVLISGGGSFRFDRTKMFMWAGPSDTTKGSVILQPCEYYYMRTFWMHRKWSTAKVEVFTSREHPHLMAPYWSIVIPLTALSAYLLLSKPRLKPASPQMVVRP